MVNYVYLVHPDIFDLVGKWFGGYLFEVDSTFKLASKITY